MVDPYAIVRRLTGRELISPKDAQALTEAVDGLIDEIKGNETRIASLQEQVEKLTRELELALKLKRQYLHAATHWYGKAEASDAKLREGAEPVAWEIEGTGSVTNSKYQLETWQRQGVDGIRPLYPHPTEQTNARSGVRVKAMEWKHYDNGNAYARTPFLAYIANTDGTWLFRNGVETKAGDDLDAAKAAAQADYERRILSALSPAAPRTADEIYAALEAIKSPAAPEGGEVTEAMVEIAAEAIRNVSLPGAVVVLGLNGSKALARAALTAALAQEGK